MFKDNSRYLVRNLNGKTKASLIWRSMSQVEVQRLNPLTYSTFLEWKASKHSCHVEIINASSLRASLRDDPDCPYIVLYLFIFALETYFQSSSSSKFNLILYYLRAESTAARPIIDTAQCTCK
jgi:hypothetical protein